MEKRVREISIGYAKIVGVNTNWIWIDRSIDYFSMQVLAGVSKDICVSYVVRIHVVLPVLLSKLNKRECRLFIDSTLFFLFFLI